MRLSIHTKVFLTLLLACVVVLLGTQAFVQWSFQRGLVELADAREQERIERIAERLIDTYRHDGSWEPLAQDSRRWVMILLDRQDSFANRRPDDRRFLRHPPWLRDEPGSPGVWPPQEALDHIQRRQRPIPLELRLMLLDASGAILYGRPALIATSRPYPLQLDGQMIGTLALMPGSPAPEMAELRFHASQGDRLWIIALAMLLLAAALAYPLSRRLVRPVRDFQHAARRLATGDFSARVPTHGHDEIARLGRDINALATALEHNEAARRRWVADISHELRTPIALLRAELEALQDGVRPLEPSALDTLHGDVMRLGRLVDDLYELSITDMGALGYRLEETDVAEILSADIDAFRRSFQEAGLALDYRSTLPEPLLLHADGQRLSQLFRNLLRNSRQYTDAGGGLSVQLSRTDHQLCIDFQDTTPGVPKDALPHLFERLYRVEDSRNRHSGGAGLGLAIARNVVEAHGGAISADAAPGGGLWIRILLPA